MQRSSRRQTLPRPLVYVAEETARSRPEGLSALDGASCMWRGHLSAPPVGDKMW